MGERYGHVLTHGDEGSDSDRGSRARNDVAFAAIPSSQPVPIREHDDSTLAEVVLPHTSIVNVINSLLAFIIDANIHCVNTEQFKKSESTWPDLQFPPLQTPSP